ncbi:MAG: hypothetical protein R3Y54_04795 [Eubacteriales bacterium]
MSTEQSCHTIINIRSQALGTILKNYQEVLRQAGCKMEVTYSQVMIDAIDDYNLTNVPQDNKEVVSIFCDILKSYLGKESKPIIKEIKKAKKVIADEAICDWSYVETCVGELAKEMSQIQKKHPNLEEAQRVEQYIYEISFINGVYSNNERAVYIE